MPLDLPHIENAAPLHVLVLLGGPDRERDVSLQSGASVAAALREAGHVVTESDISPHTLSVLGDFPGDVIVPVLHGPWGEGGPLQKHLQAAGKPYVGCGPEAAERCMNKAVTKRILRDAGLPTADFEVIRPGEQRSIPAPVVVKALTEGSSLGLEICHDEAAANAAVTALLADFGEVMVERFLEGSELTVGVVAGQACSPLQIVPKVAFYDYEAKYERDDTEYRFDIDLPAETLAALPRYAEQVFAALGCRHLSRVDFMTDADGGLNVLEVNTMPGFTSHSLLPKSAAHDGVPMPRLVDHLVRMAVSSADG